MAIQVDEPAQKGCVYRVSLEKSKYYQVRVKSITFHEQAAVAIYFYNVTHHMESLKLSKRTVEQKSSTRKTKNAISDSQMIIEQEFRTPLSTSLMFLENLLLQNSITAATKQVLMVITS